LGLESSNKFFSKAKTDFKIIPLDYEYHAKLLSKNGKDSLAILDYKKALELQPDKIELNGDIANEFIKMKKYPEAIAAYKDKIAKTKPTINDYFGLTRAYYQSKDFINADSSAYKMINVDTNQVYGYLYRAKSNSQLDPKNEKWLAKPFYEKYIAKATTTPADVEKNKKDLVDAYNYIGVYYINHKDNCAAKAQFLKVQGLDPTNANAKKFLDSAEAKKCP
jgi:tetratricopeptide (TPR) repeat protein